MNQSSRALIASTLLVLSAQIPALSQNTLFNSHLLSTSTGTPHLQDEYGGTALTEISQLPTSRPKPSTFKPQVQRRSCPKDVETLTALLIRDLPNYTNRAIQRARSRTKISGFSTSVILAGHPEFKPLTLGPGPYIPSTGSTRPEDPQQVFLTTLERSYTTNNAIELQQYHWLFLTQTPDGWRLVTMFSQIGSYPAKAPPAPPRESSNSVIGQAIRTWLEDCRAGEVHN